MTSSGDVASNKLSPMTVIFSAGHLYGNAFWMEQLSDNRYRFYCNDHRMDDDFDDLIFDLEIESMPNK